MDPSRELQHGAPGRHSNLSQVVENRNPTCLSFPRVKPYQCIEGGVIHEGSVPGSAISEKWKVLGQGHRIWEEAFMCLFSSLPHALGHKEEDPQAHWLMVLSMGSGEGRLERVTFLSAS